MKFISKTLLAGLAAVLPLAVTVYLLYWLATKAEAVLGTGLQFLIPPAWYHPGLGLAAGVIVLFLIGLLARTWLLTGILRLGDRLLGGLPLVKTVYGAIRDLTRFLAGGDQREFDQVVSFRLGEEGPHMLGFVTRADLAGSAPSLGRDDVVAVYLPMSYQIGGYTLLVRRERLMPVAMSLEDAMRFTVTAGMSFRK
ncbi:MAG: DUF502 domain-containing protein [Gammaproteobacteria bacterium]